MNLLITIIYLTIFCNWCFFPGSVDDNIDDLLSQVQQPAVRTASAAAYQFDNGSRKSVSDETAPTVQTTSATAEMDEVDIMKYISETGAENDVSDSLF